MRSAEQGSSDNAHGKMKQTEKTRRSWSKQVEDTLIAALKELVAHGWKSDNGFRAGYLRKLEDAMKKEFPGTDIKGMPHINSKLSIWKKHYYSLTQILSRSGVGFNLRGTHMIDCDNEQWEQIVKCDNNARLMRFKSWAYLDDWKEIFGRDRATGDSAEDVIDAVNDLLNEDYTVMDGDNDDYHVSLDEIFANDVADTSVCQTEKVAKLPKKSGNKRKTSDGMDSVCEFFKDISRDTNCRLKDLISRIGYDHDLGQARKDVFKQLGTIPGLTMKEKFEVCEILAAKVERLEIFLGLPEDARLEYVLHLMDK